MSPPQGNKLLGFSGRTNVRVHASGPWRSEQKSQHAVDLTERFIREWDKRPSQSGDMRERQMQRQKEGPRGRENEQERVCYPEGPFKGYWCHIGQKCSS